MSVSNELGIHPHWLRLGQSKTMPLRSCAHRARELLRVAAQRQSHYHASQDSLCSWKILGVACF